MAKWRALADQTMADANRYLKYQADGSSSSFLNQGTDGLYTTPLRDTSMANAAGVDGQLGDSASDSDDVDTITIKRGMTLSKITNDNYEDGSIENQIRLAKYNELRSAHQIRAGNELDLPSQDVLDEIPVQAQGKATYLKEGAIIQARAAAAEGEFAKAFKQNVMKEAGFPTSDIRAALRLPQDEENAGLPNFGKDLRGQINDVLIKEDTRALTPWEIRNNMAKLAISMVGDPSYTFESDANGMEPNSYKCNLFVYDVGRASGVSMPTNNALPLRAWQWTWGVGDRPGWERVGFDERAIGDVISEGLPGSSGHCGFVVGSNMTVSAGYAPGAGVNGVVVNDWGYRSDWRSLLKQSTNTYYRYVGNVKSDNNEFNNIVPSIVW